MTTTTSTAASALKALPLFALLDEQERAAIQPWIQVRTYPARAAIVRAGDAMEGLYLLVSGRACLMLENGHGRDVVLDMIEPNDVFGELSVFAADPGIYTICAQRACEVLYLPRRPMSEVLQRNVQATLYLARMVARRLETAHRKIGGLALQDVYTRVIDVILQRGHEEGGAWLVDVGSELIASMVGASREMVSRVMKDMAGRGLVRKRGRRIIVDDRDKLREWERGRQQTLRRKPVASLSHPAPSSPAV